MSFAKPAVPTSQDIESLKSVAYEEIAHISPSLAKALGAEYVEHPRSSHSPAETLETLEKCKTVEGALIVCSGLYVDTAISVMDTMPYWEQAGRPTREQAIDPTFIVNGGNGSARYFESKQQLGLLNLAMNELTANITKGTTLNFEVQIRLMDAYLWKELVFMCQKTPITARFLRERLHMLIDTYGSIGTNNPRNHTKLCQGALEGQEYKSAILKNPRVEVSRILTEVYSDGARLAVEIEEQHSRKEANKTFFEGEGKEVWDLELGRLVARRDEAQKLYAAAKAASDELDEARGNPAAKRAPRILS